MKEPKVRVVTKHEIIVTRVPAKDFYDEPDPRIEEIVRRVERERLLRERGLL